jgi:hypothetical protein
MTPIERLQSLPADSFESFDLAHSILMGDHPMTDKLAALERIDQAMGGTGEPINEQAVADYIRTHTEG